jgi:ATP/maltotriose-dependent transcriptional regulator MalT
VLFVQRCNLAHSFALDVLNPRLLLKRGINFQIPVVNRLVKVVLGLLNKQIAAELGMTEKTVKFHRGHIMRKMRVQSVADLVLMADQL